MKLSLIWDILFPPCCAVCRKVLKGDFGACEDCVKKVRINSAMFCGSCHARFPSDHKECHRDTPFILCAAADYSDATVQPLIKQLKFKGIRSAALPLAAFIARYFQSLPISESDFLIIPMPLGPRREHERGFNQAELIATALAANIGHPIEQKILIRKRETQPQSEQSDRSNRSINVKDCFEIKDNKTIIGRTVIVIDDVSTSGATLKEAAQTLKTAGAKKVYGLVAAKA